jgi:hypothetical protein
MRTSTKRLLAAGLLGVLIGVVQVALAQSSNSDVGTWKLNLAKSKYNQGPAPKSSAITIQAASAGTKVTVDSVSVDGTVRHWEFTAKDDGKDNPVVGNNPNSDMAARTRINASTTKTVYKKGGKITGTNTSVVSSDGKTLTITNALGQTVNTVSVWEKQ